MGAGRRWLGLLPGNVTRLVSSVGFEFTRNSRLLGVGGGGFCCQLATNRPNEAAP